jgi:ATP-dependent Clp protease ATP-binding subunit ClpA
MKIIERLISKKEELEERLNNLYHGGSQRRETLEYRIKKIDELINAYQIASSPTFNLSEAEKILNQQVGFTEQKRKILEILETEEFRKLTLKNTQRSPSILCFVGPTGTGKTTFSQILDYLTLRSDDSQSMAQYAVYRKYKQQDKFTWKNFFFACAAFFPRSQKRHDYHRKS